MARKPNYQFERMERQRAKASKKAMRLEAKRKKAEESKVDDEELGLTDGESGDSSEDPMDRPQEDDEPDQ